MFWNKYPYTDFHELNLDMILGLMKELHSEWDEFTAVNKITNAGAWDITKQYQAWTVVSDNNVGYISLKPVPAGVAINNTEYWGVIADYNILITDLSNRITILEGKTAALEADNITNKNTIDQIDEMFYSLDYLSTKKYIMIGDSYATFLDSWMVLLKQKLNLTEGVNVYSSAVGGTGFVNGSPTWVDTIGNISAPSDIDYIIVAGGYNDRGGVDVPTAIESFVSIAKSRFPKAKVLIGMCAWNAHSYDGNIVGVYKDYREGCKTAGAIYMDHIEYTLHDYDLVGVDGFHPVTAGSREIYNFMIEFLQKGHCDVYKSGGGNVINESDITGTISYTYSMFNGQTTLLLNLTAFTAQSREFYFNNTPYKLGTIHCPFIGVGACASIPCYMANSTPTYYSVDTGVFVNNGELYLTSIQTNDSRDNFRTSITLKEFGGIGRVNLVVDSLTQR